MNKKFFHPGSFPNIKRKWMAEQKALAKEKTEQDMKEQYQKEQSTYQNKMMITKKEGDKIKLGLNFMYEAPPGMKKDAEKQEEGEEVKFEWQKTAPREGYSKNLGLEVHDQPFGVCVRNVKCFKCGKWGHQNVDKECPLYSEKKEVVTASGLDSMYLNDPLRLMADMKREHGLTLRKSVIGREVDPMAANQQILDSDDENPEIDVAYVESLSNEEKKQLLKRLEKLERKEKKERKKLQKRDKAERESQEDKKIKEKSSKKEKLMEKEQLLEEEKLMEKEKTKRRGKEERMYKRHHDKLDNVHDLSRSSDRRLKTPTSPEDTKDNKSTRKKTYSDKTDNKFNRLASTIEVAGENSDKERHRRRHHRKRRHESPDRYHKKQRK